MCTVMLNIDEALVRRINPSLTDRDAITCWMQRLMDNMIDNLTASFDDPMKPYTIKEIHAMLNEAEADFAAGRFVDDDDVWREYDEITAREKQL